MHIHEVPNIGISELSFSLGGKIPRLVCFLIWILDEGFCFYNMVLFFLNDNIGYILKSKWTLKTRKHILFTKIWKYSVYYIISAVVT